MSDMRQAVVFGAPRSGYGIDQIADRALTVGELIRFLADYDEDTLFVLSHDSGYTYGSVDLFTGTLYAEAEPGKWMEWD